VTGSMHHLHSNDSDLGPDNAGRIEAVFKAYDIRGTYPDELDESLAYGIGAAFAAFCESGAILLGRDMRVSSPSLAAAFIKGAAAQGKRVLDIGMVSTDALYFASGLTHLPGAIITASHNPGHYNGVKLCGPDATPISEESGLETIKALAKRFASIPVGTIGTPKRNLNVLNMYAHHCRSFVIKENLRPLKVAIDAGSGMAGVTAPLVFAGLPFTLVPLNFEPDGTFPSHPANPIEPKNLEQLQEAVLAQHCDVGIAFDGDADRMFLVDEKASPVSGSVTTALVAATLLDRSPDETVLYNLICSRVVAEVIESHGGRPYRTRVGHSFIKKTMADTGALFAGEHSGHYYFRDNYRADSGMIAALVALEALSVADRPLSELLVPYDRYHASGEINLTVRDINGALKKLGLHYIDGKQDLTDGLTIEYPNWWFNCRPSNTEPLLRLNVEAVSAELLEHRKNEIVTVLATIDGRS
jgi:phosphomannomutase